MNATLDKTEQLPLLRRPVKPGQMPPIGLTPQETTGKIEKAEAIRESGGPEGAEPTRFGDWERKGRCSDF
ncbi:MAG: succinate dehydrogenase assembly factor 4 [Rhodospirillales bacterium]